ncbi:DUF4350 domain-containing protein [Caulobacter mirabilis]|uniref:DUF4350 domain-containing protein n=1 Tax=Caulobacter mirabilis TaxID=69666 RepID=A0A2D2B285_9CAUL|nr:DUF4350 domain-containing protein [Caulobacter mirabilis]ATQ44360.1 hypothetical protein CSW64_19195 [Caulobacter mirabilis]
MRFAAVAALGLALTFASPALAQQEPDAAADVSVTRPAWPAGAGPVAALDEGHRNFHTLDGRYGPFAALLRSDGYQVRAARGPITAESLKGVRVLMIANARAPEGSSSAFTLEEIAMLKAWVGQGGSLLLIADHMPFAGAATTLGQAFGFTFEDGYTQIPREGPLPDIFTPGQGLGRHAVTTGRSASERIDELATFTGSAFTAPAGAVPILTLPAGSKAIKPDAEGRIVRDGSGVDVGGWLQGAVMDYGKGRLAVFGEAGMFSAQIVRQNDFRMGFNSPRAPRNKQFALNLLHWLSGGPAR